MACSCPDAISISEANGNDYTYEELLQLVQRSSSLMKRLVNRLSTKKQKLGLPAVMLCGLDSVALAIAELSVLTAGCVIIPVDPAQPSRRLRCILEDSGAMLVLTNATEKGMLEDKIHEGNETRETLIVSFDRNGGEMEDLLAEGDCGEERESEPVRSMLPVKDSIV